MPKFVFVCEHEAEAGFGARTNMVEFTADTYDEVISEMTDFLRGCGYQFKGELQLVKPETTCTPSNCQHSAFYFDTMRNR